MPALPSPIVFSLDWTLNVGLPQTFPIYPYTNVIARLFINDIVPTVHTPKSSFVESAILTAFGIVVAGQPIILQGKPVAQLGDTLWYNSAPNTELYYGFFMCDDDNKLWFSARFDDAPLAAPAISDALFLSFFSGLYDGVVAVLN